MNQQIYIHIGMPRTATTFFQQEVFPYLPETEFHNLDETHYAQEFNKLQFSDDSLYDANEILKVKEKWKGKKVLLSNENFIGQSTHFNHINRSIVANRLKQAFPDAKILLVLRNQVDLLASLYAINLQWKETRKIDDFIWKPFQKKQTNEAGGPASSYYNTLEGYESLDGYRYSNLIDLYKSLFEHVEILLFEDFIKTPQEFSTRLASFFHVEDSIVEQRIINRPKMNSGVSEKQAKKLARLNYTSTLVKDSRIGNRVYNKLKRNILQATDSSKKPFFSEEKESELKNYFREDNLVLQQKYPEIGINKYSKKYYIE